jgi:hypothetical protein
MSDMFFGFSPVVTDLDNEKDRHYDRINKLRDTCEREMFAYIEKYVLDGRELGEVFPVAHYSAVNDVEEKGYVYGRYVLEHIIEYEDDFSNKADVKQCYESMVKTGRISSRSNH